jgi:putative transcriptional regulator
LADVLSDMKIVVSDEETLNKTPVLYGGPVHQERGFVIHRPPGQWRATLVTGPEISVTTSRDILEALAGKAGPEDVIIALGCAAWETGQLEHEIIENSWLTIPADASVLYTTPYEQRWVAAAAKIGVDFNNLSEEVGHG